MNKKLFLLLGLFILLSATFVAAGTPTSDLRYWIDCDSDQASCETSCGFTNAWLKSGLTNETNQLAALLGEYSDTYEECCGDDINELVVSSLCNATRNPEPRCCTNETIFHMLDGRCTKDGFCPDIMRGAPVWLAEANDTLVSTWNGVLQSNGVGYCCDGTAGNFGPLCGSEKGCYLTTNSLPFAKEIGQYPPAGPEYKEYCSTNTSTDPYCVAEACQDNLQICERSEVCNETTITVQNGGNVVYCNPGSYTTQTLSNYDTVCYPVPPAGCDPAKYVDCDVVTEVDYTGTGNCYARCLQHEDGSLYSCHEVCSGGTGTSVTTYRGPNCHYDPGFVTRGAPQLNCELQARTCSSHTEVTITNPSSCSSTAPGPVQYIQTDCSDELFCDALNCSDPGNYSADENLYCWQGTSKNGFDLVLQDENTSELFSCSDDLDSQNQGDYWCPDGYVYDLGQNRCELDTAICDQGYVGNLANGCDQLTNPQDDFWSLYDDDCMYDTITPNAYDQTCCFAEQIGNFQVYNQEFVKVY